MTLNYYNEDNKKIIVVSGGFLNEGDIFEFYGLFNEKEIKEYEITFANLNFLPMEVIDFLAHFFLQNREKKVKIYSFSRALYSYLNRIGCTNFFIPKKAEYNSGYMKNDYKIDEWLELFLEALYRVYGYDFREFEKESLKRRIRNYMDKNQIASVHQFETDILDKEEVFEEFFLDLGVNVTSFFRDADIYKKVRENIVPLFKSNMHIKIWCAGCSTGEEAYSMAIILHEMGLLHKSHIYATDWNEHIVSQAINGFFSKNILSEDTKNYLKSGGTSSFSDYFDINDKYMKIKDFLKEKILFFSHSLTSRGVLNEFDLILCRNVMIYFDKKLQLKVFDLFHKSMDKSSFLLLGRSEKTILKDAEKLFNAYDNEAAIFQPLL